MHPAPPWSGVVATPNYPPLLEDLRTGVCVVGGGLTGLSTALLLSRHGTPVTLVERGFLGSGESGKTTGHVTTALDAGYRTLERRRGASAARLAAESQSAAMELLSGLCAEHGISCGLETVDGYQVGRLGHDDELEAESQAAKRAGLIEVERLGRVPGELFGPLGCIRFPRQAQVDPARLVAGLARALERLGCRIYGGTRVVAIEGKESVRLVCESGRVLEAQAAVVAAHDVLGPLSVSGRPIPSRTYAIAAPIPNHSLPRALYWDSEKPYHYVRVFSLAGPGWPGEPKEYLVVGGEDHPTGREARPEEGFARLEAWMRKFFPMARAVTHRWSGQILETPDGLPSIGRDPRRPNVFFATGFSGTGVTSAAAAGMVLSDLVHGRPNPWAELYDPARVGIRPVALAREGLRFARTFAAWLAPGEARAARELEPGCGAVVRCGVRAVALYRDEAGNLHRLSAACKHRGCIVRWNDAERSWDCPCHGSRYDGLGRVVNGPAVEGLTRLEPEPRPEGI